MFPNSFSSCLSLTKQQWIRVSLSHFVAERTHLCLRTSLLIKYCLLKSEECLHRSQHNPQLEEKTSSRIFVCSLLQVPGFYTTILAQEHVLRPTFSSIYDQGSFEKWLQLIQWLGSEVKLRALKQLSLCEQEACPKWGK